MPTRPACPQLPALARRLVPVITLLLAVQLPAASDSVTELRRTPLQWIEIRKRAVDAENKWGSDREILQHSLFIMGETLSELTTQIEEQTVSALSGRDTLDSTETRLQEKRQAQAMIAARIDQLEASVTQLARFAPPPLAKKIETSLLLLGGGQTEADSLALRIQSVAAILTHFDQFNKDLTETRILKTFDDGSTSEVRVLYWGLALAYAATPDGKRAWTLQPAANQWTWTAQPQSAVAIRDLFRAYDKDIAPEFIAAPVTLTDIR